MASGGIPDALKKQLATADKFFAAGDLRSAKMHATMAKNFFPAAAEAQRAHAAYTVHAAAAGGKPDHYAVLGVAPPLNGKPSKETHDAIKTQHKAFCELLDPAKADGFTSAAAAAYKLVNEAFAALTDIKCGTAAMPAASFQRRLPPLRSVLKPKVAAAARGGAGVTNGGANRRPAVVGQEAEAGVLIVEEEAPLQQDAAAEEEDPYYAGMSGVGERCRRGRPVPVLKY